jgi:hypothetical protein
VSWKDEFCACDALRKEQWGTRLQYGLDVCGFCLKPFLRENYVTDEIIAWRREKSRTRSTSTASGSGSTHLSQILISSIVFAVMVVALSFAVVGIKEGQELLPQAVSTPTPSADIDRPQPLGEYFGQTAIEYNFGIACDRLRAQIYEGTAAVFREAGTMGEEDGDLDLAMIAYRYADALDRYDTTEDFEECNNR